MKKVVICIYLFAIFLFVLSTTTVHARFIDGADVGVILGEDAKPALAVSIVESFSMESVGGDIFTRAEIMLLRADRKWEKGKELYVIRTFVLKQFQPSIFYLGFGVGDWYMINTAGPDVVRFAVKFTAGMNTGPLHCNIAGEQVSIIDKPDMTYVHIGIVLKL